MENKLEKSHAPGLENNGDDLTSRSKKFQSFGESSCNIYVFAILLSVLVPVHSEVHVLHFDIEHSPIFTTNNKFLSIAIGSSLMATDNTENFDTENPRLHKLLSPLSPGYLRIGGTTANRLHFVPGSSGQFEALTDGEDCFYEGRNCKEEQGDFIMSGEKWLSVNKLASNAGLKILFDINVLTRLNDGSWDSSNAETLIEFSSRHNLNVIWELGNEPTLYKNHYGLEISAPQLAMDFIKLRKILNRYPIYKDALLVGPDMAQPRPNNIKLFNYLEDFLHFGGNAVDAVTWHQYNLNGNNAKPADFLHPDAFDELKNQIVKIQDTVKSAGISSKRLWLGETANAYSGGARNISDRFIASFLWLDKLGVSAQYGLDVVIRQTFFRSNYALVDTELEPRPDWWLSVIYKQLVGTQVISCSSETSKFVRLYCHCTKKPARGPSNSSITVFGVNIKDTEARVQLRDISSESAFEYILTAPNSHLTSKNVLLNNELLTLLPNGNVPQLKARHIKTQPFLVMPPHSLAFWVIPTPSFSFC